MRVSAAPALLYLCWATQLFGMKPSVHYKLAYQAAVNPGFGFSEAAAKIIAIGATAPDKYDWGTAAAHAQTPNDSAGNPTMTRDQAISAFDQYVQEKSAQIDSALSSGDAAGALYRIGYLMHAFQDLAAHMGITNYTHSHLDAQGHSPDTDPDRIARAETWSADFLQRVSDRGSTTSEAVRKWDELRNYNGTGPDDFNLLSSAISSGDADRTWGSLGSYALSRFSRNDPPSGGWGGISDVETIRLTALAGVHSPNPAERAAFERNQEKIKNETLSKTSRQVPTSNGGDSKAECEKRNADRMAQAKLKNPQCDCVPKQLPKYCLQGNRVVQCGTQAFYPMALIFADKSSAKCAQMFCKMTLETCPSQ